MAPSHNLVESGTFAFFAANLREGLCLAVPGGEIVDANPAFLEMFGVRAKEDLASSDARRLLLECEERETSALHAATSAVAGFEFEVRRADEERRTSLATVYRVPGDGLLHVILFDISERKRLEAELTRQALRDPLTGCFNRRYLAQRALELETESDRWGCIVLDLDAFGAFNAELGEERGDRELVRLSRFLLRATRAHEAVIRIGGDEFLLLLSTVGEETTGIVADRLRLSAAREEVLPFTLGYAMRDADESVLSTLDRAVQRLKAIRASSSGPHRRIRETALARR